MNKVSAKTFKGVDLFKAIAAILIVSLHIGNVDDLIPLKSITILGHIGVPFFAIVASFLFFKKFNNINDKNERIYKLWQYMKRILFLFLVWQIFYIPLALRSLFQYIHVYGNNFECYVRYIYHFFLSPATGYKYANGWAPSWYLIATIIGLPIFIFMCKLLKSNIFILGIVAACLELMMIMSTSYGLISHVPMIGYYSFPRLIPYFFIGWVMAIYNKKIYMMNLKKVVFFTLVCLIIFYLETFLIYKFKFGTFAEETFFTAPTSIAVTCLAFKINPSFSLSMSKSLRNFSTFLYCSQEISIAIVTQLIPFHDYWKIVFYILSIMLSYVAFKLFIQIKKKLNWSIWNYMI